MYFSQNSKYEFLTGVKERASITVRYSTVTVMVTYSDGWSEYYVRERSDIEAIWGKWQFRVYWLNHHDIKAILDMERSAKK